MNERPEREWMTAGALASCRSIASKKAVRCSAAIAAGAVEEKARETEGRRAERSGKGNGDTQAPNMERQGRFSIL